MNAELLERLHPSLRTILNLELAQGNEVFVALQGDSPRPNQVVVCLKLPFARRYDELEEVRLRPTPAPTVAMNIA